MIKKLIHEDGFVPIKIWTDDIEDSALSQLKNISRLPFIHDNGIAAMPDVHYGIGATIGSVLATSKAIIPAAVGVDIGCGMVAVRLSLRADDLPESLSRIRSCVERETLQEHTKDNRFNATMESNSTKIDDLKKIVSFFDKKMKYLIKKAAHQMGTLGGGNHFIEICLDQEGFVWVMLHSGSRGVGNAIGNYFINEAKEEMQRYFVSLPDKDLAYLPEGTELFDRYVEAVQWAQDYAYRNRAAMMEDVLSILKREIPKQFECTNEAINCHHNYVTIENHFGKNLWITRKGAIRAQQDDLGIIPGSMGQKSYIVKGKGNCESYNSCSHGAGRAMGRNDARKRFTVENLKEQTIGVECKKDASVLDEIPSAYKDIDVVMENQKDLIEVLYVLKQVLCVKG